MKSTIASAAMSPLTQLMAAVALSSVLVIALIQSRTGLEGATVGGFVAFITAMLMLVSPIKRLADVTTPITRGLAALERGLDLLEQVSLESDLNNSNSSENQVQPQTSGASNMAIEFDNVSVHYGGDTPPALHQLSLKIQPQNIRCFLMLETKAKDTSVPCKPK